MKKPAVPLASEDQLGADFAARVPFVLAHVRVFRRQIVNGKMERGHWATAGIPGQADYYALVRGGMHVEIEIKAAKMSGNKAVIAKQLAWREYCEKELIPYMMPRARKGEEPTATVERWVEELREMLRLRGVLHAT